MAELLTPAQLLEMFEGNRRLTIRTIEAFADKDLFGYTPVAPLRPFADMVKEVLDIEVAYVRGIATGEWAWQALHKEVNTKQGLLEACESVRSQVREWWPKVTTERLVTVEEDGLFGPAQSNLNRLVYALENEIHHRGQGYIYLRLLGTEPPEFYVR
jgi:uncharacterized damage-inducible protein DinB